MMGRHKRRGIRRRRGKAAVLALMGAMLLALSSWAPVPERPQPGRWDNPLPSMLAYAAKSIAINGDAGEAHVYLTRWPELLNTEKERAAALYGTEDSGNEKDVT